MSKADVFENDLLKLTFQATAISGLADNAASGPLTSLYVSLHTADPGETGSQTTSEASYTSYARAAVARSGSGFTVSGTAPTTVNPVGTVSFPQCTGGSGTATYF